MSRLNFIRYAAVGMAFVSSMAVAGTGVFVGAQAGYGYYDSASVPPNVANSQKHLTGGLFAGYLLGNRALNYGGEIEVNAFSKKTWNIVNDKYTLKSEAINLLGVVRYYPPIFDSNTFVQAMAGGAYIQQRTKTIGVSGDPLPIDIGGSKKQWKPVLGVGIGYTIADQYNLGLVYESILGNKTAPFYANGNPQTRNDFNKIAEAGAIMARFSLTFS